MSALQDFMKVMTVWETTPFSFITLENKSDKLILASARPEAAVPSNLVIDHRTLRVDALFPLP